jgi:hypothetical protein
MHSIMCKIDTIRFAADYNDLNQHEKTGWLRDAYAREFRDLFADGRNREDVFSEHKAELEAWKSQMGRETMARNRLYRLFIDVSGSPSHPRVVTFSFRSTELSLLSTPFGPRNSYVTMLPPIFTAP